MLDRIQLGMRVRDVSTGRRGVVVVRSDWDRLYLKVRFEDGAIETFEGTRELERVPRA